MIVTPSFPRFRIRPATVADAESIGRLVADELAEKVRPAFGRRSATAMTALVRRDLPRDAVRYLVVDEDGDVVAAARLALRQEPSEADLGPLVEAIGLWPAIRGAIVLGLLTHVQLGLDEAYVEEFVVRSDRRRLGIGRALLAACEAEAVAAGSTTATLWVAEHNTAAVALYRDAGYSVCRRRATLRGRIVFRAPVALLMAKHLDAHGTRSAVILPGDVLDARPDQT